MRYSFEFKVQCVEMYRQGRWPDTPAGVTQQRFRNNILLWKRTADACGLDALFHKNQNRGWTAENRYELVAKVLAGNSYTSVAIDAVINPGQLYNWVRKYNELGYNGLENMKKGRPRKEPQMKKKSNPTPLNESEREELIRLREEAEYLRTELAVIKKLEALRIEKEAAQLKAKKQQLSKNSESKDSN